MVIGVLPVLCPYWLSWPLPGCVTGAAGPLRSRCAPGRHSISSASSGVASMRIGKRFAAGEQEAVAARAGQQPALQVLGEVEGVADGADRGGVLLEQELEGGVLEQGAPRVAGDGAGGVLGEQVLHVLGDELQPEAVLPRALRHAHHEGRALGVLHDRPDLVDDEQPRLRIARGGGPDRLRADHRGSGPQLRLQQAQVKDSHERLVGKQVVTLVGEQVAQAARGEGPQQLRKVGVAVLAVAQEGEKVAEAGAFARLRVIGGEGVVEGGPALGAERLPDHHLDQPPEAADAQQQLLGVAAVDDEGVHAPPPPHQARAHARRRRGPCRRTRPRGRSRRRSRPGRARAAGPAWSRTTCPSRSARARPCWR